MDEQAEAQVEAFLDIAKGKYGLTDDDITGLVGELVRLQKRAAFARRMGEYTAKAIITFLIGAFFTGVGWSFLHFIKSTNGH